MATRLRLSPLLAAALACAPAVAQTRPAGGPTGGLATRPATIGPATTEPGPPLAQLQRKAREDMAKQTADAPTLPPAPLSAVAVLGRDGDHLRVLTAQPPTASGSRIDVDGLPGICTLTVADLTPPDRPRPAPATRPVVPGSLLFNWFEFDRPGAVISHTFVEVVPANIQLSRVVERPFDAGTTVLLLERRNARPAADVAEPVVYLKVTDEGGGGQPGAGEVYVTADSFGALCRTHPAEVARYVEPILRDWHADAAVLPVDSPLEYQVFAADVTVDPAVADRVAKLVAQLDADDFQVRDAAGEQLRAVGPTAAAAVAKLDPSKLSPEQRARTAALLRQFRPVTEADATRLRDDVDFLLNCLNDADPFVVRTALGRLAAVVGRAVPFDATLDGQARRDAVWMLRQTLPRPAAATRPD